MEKYLAGVKLSLTRMISEQRKLIFPLAEVPQEHSANEEGGSMIESSSGKENGSCRREPSLRQAKSKCRQSRFQPKVGELKFEQVEGGRK